MNQLAILASGNQNIKVETSSQGYQLIVEDPTGNQYPLGGPGSFMYLPPLPIGELYLIFPQNFGTKQVDAIALTDPKTGLYTCSAAGGAVLTVTIK